jgi:hypothetical protein
LSSRMTISLASFATAIKNNDGKYCCKQPTNTKKKHGKQTSLVQCVLYTQPLNS